MKKIWPVFALIFITSLITTFVNNLLFRDITIIATPPEMHGLPVKFPDNEENIPPDVFSNNFYKSFRWAAQIASTSVVHIKTSSSKNTNILEDDLGETRSWSSGAKKTKSTIGSGVIISSDGYIITNNHVLQRDGFIEITLPNKQERRAVVVGVDEETDLALLKIDAFNLKPMQFGNSDSTYVGDWILAVGNPLNLRTTVTAGIVSAKDRKIEKNKSGKNTGSYIQTDAVVNPGNSGGALVNLRGELVGINTLIASTTGTYDGYAFAIPVNVVVKVAADLKTYGVTKRAFLGANFLDIDQELALRLSLPSLSGICVEFVNPNGAAAEAGLRKWDVITEVQNYPVINVAQLQQRLSQFNPGDVINLTYLRDGREYYCDVLLKNQKNNTEKITSDANILDQLGADFYELELNEARKIGLLHGGIRVSNISRGLLRKYTPMLEGFIITNIDGKIIRSVRELEAALGEAKSTKKKANIEGIYPPSSTTNNKNAISKATQVFYLLNLN